MIFGSNNKGGMLSYLRLYVDLDLIFIISCYHCTSQIIAVTTPQNFLQTISDVPASQ